MYYCIKRVGEKDKMRSFAKHLIGFSNEFNNSIIQEYECKILCIIGVGAEMSTPKMSSPKTSTPKISTPKTSTVSKCLLPKCLLCQNVYTQNVYSFHEHLHAHKAVFMSVNPCYSLSILFTNFIYKLLILY